MKFGFIKNHASEFSISLLCELFEVARSSYYAYLKQSAEPSKREQANEVLLEKIKSIFEKHKGRYGSPRIHKTLSLQGERCSLGRVKRLMRKAGLYALSGKKFKPSRERRTKLETRNLLLEHNIRPTAINQV